MKYSGSSIVLQNSDLFGLLQSTTEVVPEEYDIFKIDAISAILICQGKILLAFLGELAGFSCLNSFQILNMLWPS